MRVLVTGGAGYIGSVVTEQLVSEGHEVVVYDNLRKGHEEAVVPGATFVRAELSDAGRLCEAFRNHRVESVVHMAADSLVGESMKEPSRYYGNNVAVGLGLLDAMRECGVKQIVFSSTAAVYGEPAKQPIEESDPVRPTNPYGETKLAFERALRWYDEAYAVRYVSLRYFNAAGASTLCGEDHNPETHLIPIVLQAAAGFRACVDVYGDDYPTPDGTCVRDYIHVRDLAQAHVLALRRTASSSAIYNLGCGGGGYSVRQVIDTARRVTGREITAQYVNRRLGDPAVLIASSERIRAELGWRPQLQNLESIIASAWEWMKKHPGGYKGRSVDPIMEAHESAPQN